MAAKKSEKVEKTGEEVAAVKPERKASRKTVPAVAVASAGSEVLAEIVKATLDETRGFIYTAPAIHTPLIEAGLVEVNVSMTNEAGEIATRATPKGVSEVSNTNEVQAEAVKPVAVAGFVIEADVPVPAISGRGRSSTTYPFDKMELNHSFFVPATEAKPNPAKSLASTISSANARYTEGEGEAKKQLRKFIVRSVEENGIKGARVWRTL